MEKIGDGIYMHKGIKLMAIKRPQEHPCDDCPFLNANECGGVEFMCSAVVGRNNVLRKYKEPKVEKIKLADASFKCVVPGRDVEEKIARSLCEKGLIPRLMIASIGECFVMFHSEGLNAHSDASRFCQWPQPLVSWQQALDLIATIEKPEPAFDIKPFDRVLVSDRASRGTNVKCWCADHFSHVSKDEYNVFLFAGCAAKLMIKYEGNEALLGATDTPSGWWEARNGKPVWVTK